MLYRRKCWQISRNLSDGKKEKLLSLNTDRFEWRKKLKKNREEF